MSTRTARYAMTAAEANRRLYADQAPHYDSTEGCVVDPRLKRRLRETLSFALLHLPQRAVPRVLDACGGSGNASLMLLEAGADPLTVDVSQEMLSIYTSKAESRGYRPKTSVEDIDAFLSRCSRRWDLIVFSSALHHIEDYRAVLSAAMDRVAPGGIILTIFDPTCVGSVGRLLRRLDYLIHFAVTDPSAFVRRMLVRMRMSGGARAEDIGVLAERHAMTGIDDVSLLSLAADRGWNTLRHVRFYEARFRASRAIFRFLRLTSSFSIVMQAPA